MLLKSMLPSHIVRKLMLDSQNLRLAEAKPCSGILFLDLVGFTSMSSNLSAQEVVDILNDLFSDFDEVVEKYKTCDKIKNIGDAMMIGAGVFETVAPDKAAAQLCACAVELLNVITVFNLSSETPIQIRIGIHFGPIVGGVIASLAYDVWGETVSLAAALESHGKPGRIRISQATYDLVKEHFQCESAGPLALENGPSFETYFISSMKTPIGQIIHNTQAKNQRKSPALGRLGSATNKLKSVIRVKHHIGRIANDNSTDFVKNLQEMMSSQSSFSSGLDSVTPSSLGSAPAAFFQSVSNVKNLKNNAYNNTAGAVKLDLFSLKYDAEINRTDAKQELDFKRKWGQVPEDVPLWDRPELGGNWRHEWLQEETQKAQIKQGRLAGSSSLSPTKSVTKDKSPVEFHTVKVHPMKESRLTMQQLNSHHRHHDDNDIESGNTSPSPEKNKPSHLHHLTSVGSLRSEDSQKSRLQRLDSLDIASSTEDVVIPPMRLEPVTTVKSFPKNRMQLRRRSTDASLFESMDEPAFLSSTMRSQTPRMDAPITLPNIEQRFEYYRSGIQRGKLVRYGTFAIVLMLLVEGLDQVLVQEVDFDVNVSRLIRYTIMIPVMMINVAIVKLPFSMFHRHWVWVTILCHVLVSCAFIAIGVITTQARYVTAVYIVTMMVAVFSGLSFVMGTITVVGLNVGTVIAMIIWGNRFPSGQQWDWFFANAISILGLSIFVSYNHERRQRVVFFHNGQLCRQQLVLRTSHRDYQRLLLTIFPNSVAERLQLREEAFGEHIDDVCVLFANMSGFEELVRNLPPSDLINVLNSVFTTFDALIQKHFMRKVKTIGDSIMVVAGAPKGGNQNNQKPEKQAEINARKAVKLALRMHQEFAKLVQEMGLKDLKLSVGINSGPVVAGAIGTHKFFWDVWGDTVNVASRLKTLCEPGKTQVSTRVMELVQSRYHFYDRGLIQVKGKGKMHTYFLLHPKPDCEDLGCDQDSQGH
eukprot:TRINITY_DN845_c1_g2_i2.p1 TRINITY_DN845_c1_g2~~TRINITY_DN845_c1_g2_i2.p1  ORF type:complete len:1036 (+),score=323.29 TRINITY_DN845_c1_g2_i2:167-3109(+)